MITLQDYNKSVALLIHLIVMNNAGMAARVLAQAGYPVKNYIPEPELEAALLQLHIADKKRFFEVIKNISWNPGHIATNDENIINNMINLTQANAGTDANTSTWWPMLIQYISTIPIST